MQSQQWRPDSRARSHRQLQERGGEWLIDPRLSALAQRVALPALRPAASRIASLTLTGPSIAARLPGCGVMVAAAECG